MKFLFIIISIILFSGCSNQPDVKKPPKPLPQWIHSTLPFDTQRTLYGMSIGEDREEAIKLALVDMVSKLGIQIESTFESISKETKYSYYSNSKSYIKSSISKIKINNYKVIKSHKISYREFAVMIEVDRNKFKNGLIENYNLKMNNILLTLKNLKNENALNKYNLQKLAYLKSEKLIPTILIIHELDKSFDKNKELKKIDNLHSNFFKFKNNLSFFISGNKKSYKFNNVLKNHLSSMGFNISEKKSNSINILVEVNDHLIEEYVDTNIKNAQINITRIHLEFKVFDNLTLIGGKELIIKERFKNNVNSVYKNAVLSFEKDIKSKNINDLIGLNLK